MNKWLPHITLIAFAVLLCLSLKSRAQISPSLYNYPHNHLPWYTIESDHFNVHFQKGNSRSAQVTSKIAEHIYPRITSLYGLEPDSKTNIVLNDRQDYSNGAAYFFDNHIQIWIPALDTPLRGTHDWLWDVITHEFTHIVQLQVAMKKGRAIPAIYFQWLSYSNVRRPDVLYGYPKGIITYPFASINVPAWLAEGVAQYQRSNLYHDFWDSHRDMLLRTSLLANNPIGFEEMGIFSSKNALKRERIYNQGFAFTSYLVNRYGEEVLPDLSKTLAEPGVFTVDEALKKTTGTSGKTLFNNFITSTKAEYQQATSTLPLHLTTVIQDKGFLNFYPQISPEGNSLAYLSNKKFHTGTVQLFVENRSDSLKKKYAIHLGSLTQNKQKWGHSLGEDPLIKHIQSKYSFSPSGQSIAFSRQQLNQYGERYNDLFIYDLKSNKERRLTHSGRLSSPAWHPEDDKMVAVSQSQGSTNLVEVDIKNSSIVPLTSFTNGEQVYSPSWHPAGNQLYFSTSANYSRNIARYDFSSHQTEAVLEDTLTDFRDPFICQKGNYLYFSTDLDGIFNIYRVPLNQPNSTPQKLTSVLGGAFMPHVYQHTLYFSEFKEDGYKISSVNLDQLSDSNPPDDSYNLSKGNAFKLPKKKHLGKKYDFQNVSQIPQTALRSLGAADSLQLFTAKKDSQSDYQLYPYQNTFTDLNFYPVIRFDNYTKRYGSNSRLLTAGQFGDLGRNLLRDMKLGTYFSSRDVTDQLSIYGGAMVGFASEPSDGVGDFFSPSRLTDLDRDLFLITEYLGLPFIEKQWSPTISLELYNLRRNVANGLSIEEFPCTACLPDTTNADIAYNIWEANIYLHSRINEFNLVELGAGYSPYRVQTDGFFSKELQQFVPSSSSEYFRGTTLTGAYVYEHFLPYPNQDVAPIGIRTHFRYTYESNKLLDEYDVEDGTLTPVYTTTKNHSLETSIRYGFPFTKHSSVNLYGRGFSYLNNPDDYFYLDYIGGFTGMRSYPYFAIGGNTTVMSQLSYTFPVFNNINQQLGRHTLDKLYLRLFAETGNGWGGPLNIGKNLKTGLGGEFRFAFNSYYLFPLKLFVSGAYGFNKFDVTLPEDFITESSGGNVEYGNEFIFHFGLTFDFNVLNND